MLVQYTVSASIATTLAFYAFLLPIFLFYTWRNADKMRFVCAQPIVQAYFVFFAYVILHGIFVNDGIYTFIKVINHVAAVAVFLLCTVCYFAFLETRQIQSFLKVLVAVAGVSVVISIWMYEDHTKYIDFRLVPIGRASVPTVAAYMFTTIAIIALYLFNTAVGRLPKLLYAAVFLVIGYMLVLMEARTSLGIYAAVGLLWVIFNSTRSRWFFLGATVVIGGIAALLIFDPYVYGLAGQRYERMMVRGMSFRMQLWHETIDHIVRHPWGGYGWMAELPKPEGMPDSNTAHPHNIYLATAYYMGIPGAVLFYLIVFGSSLSVLKEHFFSNSLCRLVAALLALGLISGIVDHGRVIRNVGPFWITFWMPIGMLIAVSLRDKLARNEQ